MFQASKEEPKEDKSKSNAQANIKRQASDVWVVYLKRNSLKLVEAKLSGLLLGTSTLLGQQHCLDVGQDAALSDGHTSQKLVQLLIVPECTRSRLF